ncbi:beta-galactosidase [Verrucomicrobiota bacterium]
MYYGCAWYPEHWKEERWPEDLRLMREAGMNVVRIAEFAWSRIEPTEGSYDLAWLVRAVEQAAAYDIAAVVGTPSATPPAWLTQKYPEVLSANEQGIPDQHGARCHYNVTSPLYRDLCAKVATQMAIALGQHGNVIGWQIDNEYWRTTFDPHTRKRWHKWLEKRYGTLDDLNSAWATNYWSQTYTDWSQIPMAGKWGNPCLVLAMRQFFTDMYVEFQKVQIDALRRAIDDRQWITHNAHAHRDLDWVKIGQGLDLLSWDPYVGASHLAPESFGWVSDLCRNILPQRKHWVIETQPGRISWSSVNTDLHRGETRNLAWHFFGHGADAVLFWQWRSALGGQEQYHGTVVASDGTPRPVYEEIAQTGRELKVAAEALDGKRPKGDVAVLFTYPDLWAIAEQRHHRDFDAINHMQSYYRALRERGITVDIVDPHIAELSDYTLVVAPNLHILEDSIVDKLKSYISGGGHLFLGARSGFKDAHNALLPSRQPGAALSPLLGAHVEEYYALAEPAELSGELGPGQATIWAEPLAVEADDAKILLSYGPGNDWLADKPAMVSRASEGGRITYLGVYPDDDTADRVIDWALRTSNVPSPAFDAPAGVEVCRLVDESGQAFVLNNCTDAPQDILLPTPMRDLLSGTECKDVLNLDRRGVVVLVS